MILESYVAGEGIKKDELSLLKLKLDSQIESIKFTRIKGFTEKAPKHICEAAQVCECISQITCFGSILDKANPPSLEKKSRGVTLIELPLENNYLMN